MSLNRVWAIGKNTYIRFYPNPGLGLTIGCKRYTISLHRGFEIHCLLPNGSTRVTCRRFNRKLERV